MIVAHKCLRCGSELSSKAEVMECPSCGASWPVVKGVPAYQPAEYFGEVSSEEMQKLARLAEEGHWLSAVRSQFKDSNPDMYGYIADLNRASWIPLLPIGPDSTVLDTGSGLGALTHALALNYAHVASVEPIEERVRFTKVRLEQEGLKNVDLVQTTLDRLPYFEKTFDLIVLNGMLEWVGVWQREGTPREAQVKTLTALRRLLKPNGIVLIGIENRIGFESFLGRMDHPGTRFTNLMPRAVASLYLKLRKPGFYRMLLDSAQGYRTYTYSPRGYVTLLREAGFESVDLWWPAQGYNLPHELIRLSERRDIRNYLERERNNEDQIRGRSFRRLLKDWMLVKTGLIYSMVPDVVMMARSEQSFTPDNHQSLMGAVQAVLGTLSDAQVPEDNQDRPYHAVSLKSSGFRNKSVITMADPNGGRRAIVKVANVRLPGATAVVQGFELLQRIHHLLNGADPCVRDTVPTPIGFVRAGSLVASVEWAAQAPLLDDLATTPGYFSNRDNVRSQLDVIASWLVAVQPVLNTLGSETSWQAIPDAWRRSPDVEEKAVHDVDSLSCVQHGDFFSGNLFLDRDEQRLCVIDWDQCRGGYPPLFDWFCLVTSLYYTHEGIGSLPKGQTLEEMSFRQTFFEPSWFADHVTALTNRMCDSLGLDYERVGEYFRQYLSVRHHQFMHVRELSQNERWGSLYRAFHEFFLNNVGACTFRSRSESPGQPLVLRDPPSNPELAIYEHAGVRAAAESARMQSDALR